MPTFSKVFEKLLHDKLLPHCMKSLSKNQHVFLPSCSTTTNLMVHTNYVPSSICLGLQTNTIFIDFATSIRTSFAATKKIRSDASSRLVTFNSFTRKSTALSMCCARTCANIQIKNELLSQYMIMGRTDELQISAWSHSIFDLAMDELTKTIGPIEHSQQCKLPVDLGECLSKVLESGC
ncbi:hypothetical protein J437_LFUL018363 [Ladona fulva]|uniref:Uncharacterized protein n=1 Tax=Ladona fulva TaxID=123851 RepID=A0A8K0KQU6_LADFU|nr:hypothetical protein J437_LFUL018363 [Ladona fulva]